MNAAILAAAMFTLTPTIGTLGYGGSAGVHFGAIGIRAMANTGSYSRDFTTHQIQWTGTLKLDTAGGVVDVYPFDGGFRISGGVMSNRNHVDGITSKTQTVVVNGVAYPAALVGYLTGQVHVDKSSPYFGFGWASVNKGIGWSFDIGALYHGSPTIAVQAHPTVPALVPPSFYTDLEAERVKTQNDISKYKYHPIATLGLTFNF